MRDKNLALMLAAMTIMVAGPTDATLTPASTYGHSRSPRGPQGFGGKTKRRDKQKSARKDRQANRRKAKGK